jgi:aspartyl/glutamyl-tRNA(Asn/Gln) amidotransferase C subunit
MLTKQLHHIRHISTLVASRTSGKPALRMVPKFALTKTYLPSTYPANRIGAIRGYPQLSNTSAIDRRSRLRALTVLAVSSDEPVTDIDKLSELAQIKLTDAEKKEIGPQIDRIIEWMGQLNNVDVDGVRPSMRGGEMAAESHVDTAWLRRDVEADDPKDAEGRVGVLETNDEGFVPVKKDVFSA